MSDTTAPIAPAADTPAPAAHADMQAAQGSAGAAEQFRDAVQFGLDRGLISPERAKQEMEAAGNTLPLTEAKPATDGIAPGDKVNPETLPGFEPGKAADFKLPDVSQLNTIAEAAKDGTPGRALTATETMEIQKTVGSWMEAARIPAAIGSGIASMAGDHIRAMPHYDSLDDNAKQTYELVEMGKLQRMWGPDTNKNLALARQLGRELVAKYPQAAVFLNKSGLGSNSAFIAQMAAHAKRLAAKAG